MACSECRGYHVAYCPCCDESEDISQNDEVNDLVLDATNRIEAGEFEHTDDVSEYIFPIIRKMSVYEDDEDIIREYVESELQQLAAYKELNDGIEL